MSSRTMENTGDALGQSIVLTRQARSDLSSQISVLDARLAGIGGQWQGEAASAFLRVHQAWTQQVGRLLGALDGFGAALGATERGFAATDQQVTADLAQFSSRLG
ncbi:putative ESAT-6-like protein [metagenome]|uniref:Putative ESAT-6-like protein n=1 Tax=metagenome TaxID=256318 RepID=A0A2P2CF88_9ZZZZ